MGTGEYWGAVEMQLCFRVEFGPRWSLSDFPHTRQGTPLVLNGARRNRRSDGTAQ